MLFPRIKRERCAFVDSIFPPPIRKCFSRRGPLAPRCCVLLARYDRDEATFYLRYDRLSGNTTRPRFKRGHLMRCRPPHRYPTPNIIHGTTLRCRRRTDGEDLHHFAADSFFSEARPYPRGRPIASVPGHILRRMGYREMPF